MITQVISNLCVLVLPIRKIWHFSGKFNERLSLYQGAVSKTEITDKTGILVLVRHDFQKLRFWHCSFENALESSYN